MKLKDWMDREALDQRAVAGLVPCDQSTVSRVLNGQDPSWEFMRAVVVVTAGEVLPNDYIEADLVAAMLKGQAA